MTPRWYLSSFISLEGVQATLLRDGDPLAENTYSSVVKIPVPGAIAATGFGNIVVDLPGLTLKAWQVAARPAAGPPGGKNTWRAGRFSAGKAFVRIYSHDAVGVRSAARTYSVAAFRM